MIHRIVRAALFAILFAILCLNGLAWSQAFPTRTVRIVIPFPPGGTSDILARTLAAKLTEEWGQQVIAENRPGAAGNVASEFVAKQKGDAHFLLINTVGTHAINPAIYPNLPFDPIKDFTLITNLVNLPTLLIAHPSVQAATAQELIVLAKGKPGVLTYSSAGSGSQPHLTAEMFKTMAGVDLLHVPYKGAGPQLLALVSGEVALTFATAPAAVPLVRNKQARAIAVTTAERVPALPEVPTLNEGALPGYVAVGWNGLVGPAGIPRPIVDKIHAAVAKIYAMPDMRERLISLAAEPAISTPEEFSALIKSELVKWAKAVKDSGAKLE
jgi:tripartite-type tricarboxylate transporter receptor subunit TctC